MPKRTLQILGLGTYNAAKHPRVRILLDGLAEAGHRVQEVNAPLDLPTAARVEALRRPWRLPQLGLNVLRLWVHIARGAWRARRSQRPDVVVVGYLGHFDVVLARLLFPRTTIVLDHLIFAADTARDRGTSSRVALRLLSLLDAVAMRCASVIVLDTEEHRTMVPSSLRSRTVVVPVGAPQEWFSAAHGATEAGLENLTVVFYGLFTPLQGAPVIGEAIRILHRTGCRARFTLVGTGQDASEVKRQVAGIDTVTWHDWLEESALRDLVVASDVALGIFGTGEKAQRVVPNKVYQGAAAGCAIVTSDTPPQRRALKAAAIFVAPGDAASLASELHRLNQDASALRTLRVAASTRAMEAFQPAMVVQPLLARLLPRPTEG
ncbi:glycosyltransferase involved in cell wall biosynthesis [Serinibacter salmoneus]|uniref:Glycosyltransferase involved in cell wall biosynthesis n=1 Tax=Serinibacter salmoneus TaxID=556530 RepID=A0A2A9D1W1_9MICO|nr:glycosyltransferase involved in cell wall biosynthesis [Serinibacter salmoneus]